MRRITMCTAAVLAVSVVPAHAKAPKPTKAKSCTPHSVGYSVSGTLTSQELTQTAGQGTLKRGDDRYGGKLQVDVKKANHHAPTGPQDYTLENARVHFYDANHDRVADPPKPGDRVKIHGKITKRPKHCVGNETFAPAVTVRDVHFKAAKKAPETTDASKRR